MLLVHSSWAATYEATPATIGSFLTKLVAGDTLRLGAGKYSHFTVSGRNGEPTKWITITGPESGDPAVIEADLGPCCNTVEIVNSSYVVIRKLTIDNRGVQSAFAVSAKGGVVHHIRIEDNRIVFTNADQQDVAISTKIPTWGWEIRRNRIESAGTGMYLGNSDGNQPFVQGLIEENLIINSIGYNLQIKQQNAWPTTPGLPQEKTSTIIRHNVFIKNDAPSPSGDRPNVLFDGTPDTGPGSTNRYEVYGNFFFHNPREALLQASGDFSIHDNLFVDADSAAIVVTPHAGKSVKRAFINNNTIVTSGVGVIFGAAAKIDDLVAGNLIFAATPVSGIVVNSAANVTGPTTAASQYLKNPVLKLPGVDLFPLGGAVHGETIDLSKVASDLDAMLDFNGQPKGAGFFRGAYADDTVNCGWTPVADLKLLGTSCASQGDAGSNVDADAGREVASNESGSTSPAGCGCSGASTQLTLAMIAIWAIRQRGARTSI